jgi:hypothetical protein
VTSTFGLLTPEYYLRLSLLLREIDDEIDAETEQ